MRRLIASAMVAKLQQRGGNCQPVGPQALQQAGQHDRDDHGEEVDVHEKRDQQQGQKPQDHDAMRVRARKTQVQRQSERQQEMCAERGVPEAEQQDRGKHREQTAEYQRRQAAHTQHVEADRTGRALQQVAEQDP